LLESQAIFLRGFVLFKDLEKIKLDFLASKEQYFKHFLKQGSFSLYYSKEIDELIQKIYEYVLKECFGAFLPNENLIPFCVLASKQYAKNNLCFGESVPLLFIYKDLKIYRIKPIIKELIGLLNDLHLQIDYSIIEFDGLWNISNNELKTSIIQTRFICGSKLLFRNSKECFENVLKDNKKTFALSLLKEFKHYSLPFSKQEFDIKKDFGGLDELRALENLLTLFKDAPKNYALNFIDEKDLASLRLASEFLLSLKSAMNLQNSKDEDIFLLANAAFLADLMHKRDKKNLKARVLLIQKALQSMHTIGFYAHFLALKIQRKHGFEDERFKNTIKGDFQNLLEAFEFLEKLEDKNCEFDLEFVFALKKLHFEKAKLQLYLKFFEKFLHRKNSFCIIKLLLDSGILKELCKAFVLGRFLNDEESDFTFDISALLTLKEFEQSKEESELLRSLNPEETMLLKLVILLSVYTQDNEVSLASIFRSFCAKFSLKNEDLELGLRLFKNYNALKDLVEKEDIFNPLIICALLSKLENIKTLELLYELTKFKARALNTHLFFYKGLQRLLENAKAGFEDENLLDETARRVKKELTLKRTKVFLSQSPLLQDKITHIKSNLFIIKNSFEDIVKISALAKENTFKFWFSNESNLNLQVLATKGFNFEVILNSLTNLNLIFMNFFELFDDRIYLKFEYENIISDVQKDKLIELLNSNLKGLNKKKIKKPVIKKDELKLDLAYSKIYAKLNLNTKDQQGLMAFLMSNFNAFGLSLCAAKIQTIRQRTRNTFIFQKNEALLRQHQELLKSLISE